MNRENSQKLQVLIKDVQGGNEDAFRAIFDRLSARLFAYVLSHTSHRDDALDIVQETFIDVWKGLPRFQYKSDEQFYGFVFVVLKRKIYKRHRNMRATVSFDEEIIHESYEMKMEDYRHLQKHIGKLGEPYQDLLKLKYWSGMTMRDAADMLGITETTAKVRHHRAIKKLQAMLEQKQYEN